MMLVCWTSLDLLGHCSLVLQPRLIAPYAIHLYTRRKREYLPFPQDDSLGILGPCELIGRERRAIVMCLDIFAGSNPVHTSKFQYIEP